MNIISDQLNKHNTPASMATPMPISSANATHHNLFSNAHPRQLATRYSYSLLHATKELRWSRFRGFTNFKCAASADENAKDNEAQVSVSDVSKDELAAKLAAAEAEAEALRRELAGRRGDKQVDLAKLKPAIPEKRIDGIGYRETILPATGKAMGGEELQPSKWGLSEAELFLSKGSPSEKTQIDGPPMDDNANEIVKRRLIIGIGLALLGTSLAFFKLPTGLVKSPKPLSLYVIPIIHLRDQLTTIENSSSDPNSVKLQLKKLFDSGEISKDIFLSAAGYLEGADADLASSITYSIFDYLNQADYDKYFDYMGQPSASQQLGFLKFSLQSIQAARESIDKFLSLIPREQLEAAQSQIMQ